MVKLKEICKNCSYYKGYYILKDTHFEKQSFGKCSITNNECKYNETCERFKQDELKEKRRYDNLLINLECATKSIHQIAQVMQIIHKQSNDT